MADDYRGGHDDDEPNNVFQTSHNGWQLVAAFTLVACILTIWGTGLNRLETYTRGTVYQLMLQKIYKEIMMVGLGSFIFTILDQSMIVGQSNFYEAYGFADICCFVMAVFFCLQGLLIMLQSVSQATVWHIASNLSSEQLHIDVDNVNDSFFWKARYLPFCLTRDIVEFRVQRSIFSSAYTISTDVSDFDFGMFLKSTHEHNILHIIEISPWKWLLVIAILVGSAIIKPKSNENSGGSNSLWGVWGFIFCGVIVLASAVLIFWWGRACELRLLETVGIKDVEDYTAFVLAEDDAHDALNVTTAKNDHVRETIAELMREKLLTQDKRTHRRSSLKEKMNSIRTSSAAVVTRTFTFRQSKIPASPSSTSSRAAEKTEPSSRGTSAGGSRPYSLVSPKIGMVATLSFDEETTSASNDLKTSSDSMESATNTSMGGGAAHRTKVRKAAARMALRSFSSNIEEEESTDLNDGQDAVMVVDDISDEVLAMGKGALTSSSCQYTNDSIELSTSESELSRKQKSMGRGSVDDQFQTGTLVARKRSKGMELRKNDSAMMWRRSMQNFIKTGVTHFRQKNDREIDRDALKNRLKRNAQKQNFRQVFFFNSPELFFAIIGTVMTCNSLYLGWWATRICVVVMNHKLIVGLWAQIAYVSVSLLPAVLAFPFIAAAIRSSSVLKAITVLDLDVVGHVMDVTAANTASVEEFRTRFLVECQAVDAKNVKIGMLKLCRKFSSDGAVLTQKEFGSMLVSCGILCSAEKAKFLFSYIDMNLGSTIDMGVSVDAVLVIISLLMSNRVLCTHVCVCVSGVRVFSLCRGQT
jgi:hypothetical protein